jgi:SAM-dependent methyltransferase
LESLVAGNLLQQCRTTYLKEASSARHALLLGEGPGRYLVELLRVNPAVDVCCVDSSAAMLRAAARRLRAHGISEERVRFVAADWADWPFERHRFDLVATHFFLDCFRAEQLHSLVAKIADAVVAGGLWVISDFREPAKGWQRLRARAVLKLAYLFFRLATELPASRLIGPETLIQAQGFEFVAQRVFNHGLLYAALWRRTIYECPVHRTIGCAVAKTADRAGVE